MIPEFDAYGYLPMGIHHSSMKDFFERFCCENDQRRHLFKQFEAFLTLFQGMTGKMLRIIIDGSYVTAKPDPGDIDLILVLSRDFDFESPLSLRLQHTKAEFNIHMIPITEDMIDHIEFWFDFFGHDRERRPKGLIEVFL